MAKPFVFIVMGSDSDAEVMSQAAAALDEFGVPYQMTVASAHRSPDRTKNAILEAEQNGAAVFIAGAGMAAHLPGVVASLTTKPVIGVPLSGSALAGRRRALRDRADAAGHPRGERGDRRRAQRRHPGRADHRRRRRRPLLTAEGKSHEDGRGSGGEVEESG